MHDFERPQAAAPDSWFSARDSARQAQRILDAWEHKDVVGLRTELRLAQQAGAATSAVEEERLDLLNGIAAQMERDLAGARLARGERAATCLRLLAHLAGKRPRAANQSETLSYFPYSRFVLRISACH